MEGVCLGSKQGLPIAWPPAHVGFCGGRTGVAQPRVQTACSFSDVFSHSLWLSQQVAGWPFATGIAAGTSGCCNAWHYFTIFSFSFAKKSSSSGLPYTLVVRHNFFSHPNQPPVVSYPPRSQSICCCTWSCERKMRYHCIQKRKETRSLTT